MVRPEGFLSYSKGPLVERFCVGVATLLAVKFCQVVEALGYIGMVRAEGFLLYRKGALVKRFRINIASLVLV